jgi:hypothetical protein
MEGDTMNQQRPWPGQPQSQHPQKMPPPKTTAWIVLKILFYFIGTAIAEFGLLGGTLSITASSVPFGCFAFSIGVLALVGNTFIFFRKSYYMHCLPGLQYLWWFLGMTFATLLAFVLTFGFANPNKNQIASAIVSGILLLYGVSLIWIAYKKPSIAQQVNESTYRILQRMPDKRIAPSELLARLQKEYPHESSRLPQYLEIFAYIEQVPIPGTSYMMYHMKVSKQAVAAPHKISSAVHPLSQQPIPVPPPPPMPQSAVPLASHVIPPIKQGSKEAKVFLSDKNNSSAPPLSHQVSAVPPTQHQVLTNTKPQHEPVPLLKQTNPPKQQEQNATPTPQSSAPNSVPSILLTSQPQDMSRPSVSSGVTPPPVLVSPSQQSDSLHEGQKVIKIFCSYAHADEQLLNKLKAHLKPQQRQGHIHVWYDRDISAGTEWEQEIEEQFKAAQIILLLVSPDFMASDYCYTKEMKQALERHGRGEVRAIPIILRPTDWSITPLGKLQALPKDGKPITTWANRDNAYLDVARGIRTVVETFLAPPQRLMKQASTPNTAQQIGTPTPAIRTRCKQGTLIVTGTNIVIELRGFGQTLRSQTLLRASLSSIDSKLAVTPVFGMGGAINLTFRGKGKEVLHADLVPVKEAKEIIALLGRV